MVVRDAGRRAFEFPRPASGRYSVEVFRSMDFESHGAETAHRIRRQPAAAIARGSGISRRYFCGRREFRNAAWRAQARWQNRGLSGDPFWERSFVEADAEH